MVVTVQTLACPGFEHSFEFAFVWLFFVLGDISFFVCDLCSLSERHTRTSFFPLHFACHSSDLLSITAGCFLLILSLTHSLYLLVDLSFLDLTSAHFH